jgi:hypothetical protein
MFVALILQPSICVEVDGTDHEMEFDYHPGLLGVMPVYETREQAVAVHGRGVKTIKVKVAK